MAVRKRFAAKTQRDIHNKNVEKLKRAGLISGNLSKEAETRRIQKYRGLLNGKETAVQAPDIKTAQRLRKTLGLKGSGKTIIVPKEKGERFRYQKSTGEITSTRRGYNEGETIKKTLGPKNIERPAENRHLYYTIPERTRGAGKLKRRTFANFNEFIYYLHSYDINFEDIEDRLEIEEVTRGSRKDKRLHKQITEERAKAARKYGRKRRKGKSTKAERSDAAKRGWVKRRRGR